MGNILLHQRITIDPEVCHGKPTIRGSRLMVTTILELMAGGMTMAELLDDYPALEMADILACLDYACSVEQVSNNSLGCMKFLVDEQLYRKIAIGFVN